MKLKMEGMFLCQNPRIGIRNICEKLKQNLHIDNSVYLSSLIIT